jgi:hypothetical protein
MATGIAGTTVFQVGGSGSGDRSVQGISLLCLQAEPRGLRQAVPGQSRPLAHWQQCEPRPRPAVCSPYQLSVMLQKQVVPHQTPSIPPARPCPRASHRRRVPRAIPALDVSKSRRPGSPAKAKGSSIALGAWRMRWRGSHGRRRRGRDRRRKRRNKGRRRAARAGTRCRVALTRCTEQNPTTITPHIHPFPSLGPLQRYRFTSARRRHHGRCCCRSAWNCTSHNRRSATLTRRLPQPYSRVRRLLRSYALSSPLVGRLTNSDLTQINANEEEL